MGVEQSADQSFKGTAKGWSMTSEKGRGEIVRNIIGCLNEPGKDNFGGVSTDLIPQVSDFDDIPVSFQGYLAIAYTPDGWDYRIVRKFVKLCLNVSTDPS